MLSCLEITKPAHHEILEGFHYFLLQKVGRGLKDSVFGVEQNAVGSECRKDDASTKQSTGLAKDSSGNVDATRFQAPYLVWTLSQVRSLLSDRLQSSSAANLREQSEYETQEASTTVHIPGAISDFANIRLQNTLLKAVFGDETSSEFTPALNVPHHLPESEPLSNFDLPSDNANIRDWYKHEVWQILGWDVLSNHIWWNAECHDPGST